MIHKIWAMQKRDELQANFNKERTNVHVWGASGTGLPQKHVTEPPTAAYMWVFISAQEPPEHLLDGDPLRGTSGEYEVGQYTRRINIHRGAV